MKGGISRMKDKVDDKVKDKINKEMTEGIKKSLKSAKLSYLMNEIKKWVKANLEDVSFIGSFMTYSVERKVTDNRTIAYGPKEVLEMHLEELKEDLEKEKDFVNW